MTEPNASWQRWLVLTLSMAGVALAIHGLSLILPISEANFREGLYDVI